MELLAHRDAVGHGAAQATARLAPCIDCRMDDLGVAPDLVNHGLPHAYRGLHLHHVLAQCVFGRPQDGD
eukprot:11499793-Prorocentrum_lima.AAC.1